MIKYDVPQRLIKLEETKQKITDIFKSTGQNTNIPFRQYTELIKNIPDSGAMTYDEASELAALAIKINGENA